MAERIGIELMVAFRRTIALYWPTKCVFRLSAANGESKTRIGQTGPLPSNKEGKNSKCFAERRLWILSPEISPLVVPKLYRTSFSLGSIRLTAESAKNLSAPSGVAYTISG